MPMKFKRPIVCIALLAAAAPAWALQLGQIQVKSALDQPLVAAIPLHPKNLTELDGLTVSLAPAADFARAGLQLTPTDQTLQFHVVTDNNGQKLILVTSTEPVTDPYLDFLVQVNTREGRQVREFVVLLNPVIAAPAPEVQAAPVASAATPGAQQAAELPPASAFPQPPPAPAPKPVVQPVPKPAAQTSPASRLRPAAKPAAASEARHAAKPAKNAAATKRAAPRPKPEVAPKPKPAAAPPPPPAAPPPAPALNAGGTIRVERGDTLYHIATQQVPGTRATINQVMLALKATNPDAFFKDNINDLKAGAILRIPTRDEIDRTSVAQANAEVHRQYEAWRGVQPHPATVVEGTAAAAAANAQPKPGNTGSASDHLTLVPPTGKNSGTSNRPGVAGGTGTETVSGLEQQLQNDSGALISLQQSNSDLESRVRSLKEISGKTGKLLSLKDAAIADLQRKLAKIQSGKPSAAGPVTGTAAAPESSAAAGTAPTASAGAAEASPKPAAQPHVVRAPWFEWPLTWIIAALVVLALVLFGLLRGRRRGGGRPAATTGPLAGPEDIAPPPSGVPSQEDLLRARLADDPDDLAAHLALCRLYHEQGDEQRFSEAAESMRAQVTDPDCVEWREVARMSGELARHLPVLETPAAAGNGDPYALADLRRHAHEDVVAQHASMPPEPELVDDASFDTGSDATAGFEAEPDAEPVAVAESEPGPAAVATAGAEPEFADDPVDTKLDLARAYLDMGDPVGARAMLEEVLEEGSQVQKDEARRLLADVAG